MDFVSRNRLELHSAEESIHTELAADDVKLAELRAAIGDELFSTRAPWFYFSLRDHFGPFTFPRFPTAELMCPRRTRWPRLLFPRHSRWPA